MQLLPFWNLYFQMYLSYINSIITFFSYIYICISFVEVYNMAHNLTTVLIKKHFFLFLNTLWCISAFFLFLLQFYLHFVYISLSHHLHCAIYYPSYFRILFYFSYFQLLQYFQLFLFKKNKNIQNRTFKNFASPILSEVANTMNYVFIMNPLYNSVSLHKIRKWNDHVF